MKEVEAVSLSALAELRTNGVPREKKYWSGESMVSTIKAVDGGMSVQWASHLE